MSNIIELLLNADKESLERPSKVIEIPRLTKQLGGEFKIICKALTVSKTEDLRELCVDRKTGEVDISKLQIKTIVEGVYDLEGKWLFKNKDVQKSFKVPNPDELVRKLLLVGEMDKIFEVVTELGGFGEDSIVEEIKN